MNLWGFLSVSAIMGVVFVMFIVYLNHKKTMKKMEIEALKIQHTKSPTDTDSR